MNRNQPFIMGNWKMNGSKTIIKQLLTECLEGLGYPVNAHVVVFPPSIYLPLVSEMLDSTPIAWGAQNVSDELKGAQTGEISCSMLKEYGCQYVLVGHSERRVRYHEDENFVAKKFHQIKEHGMIPVICVGESEKARQSGQTFAVIRNQIAALCSASQNQALKQSLFQNCVIAYEPIWAIGTGLSATPEDAQAVHADIRAFVNELSPGAGQGLPVVYGGSMNPSNAEALLRMPDIDGGLIGGASLKASQFLEILTCTNS